MSEIIRETRIVSADGTHNSVVVDRRQLVDKRLPWVLSLRSDPEGTNLTGPAIDAKVQHSDDQVEWDDVQGGAVAQITAVDATSADEVLTGPAALKRFVRVQYGAAATAYGDSGTKLTVVLATV